MNELSGEALHLWRGEHHVLRGVSFAVVGGQCLQVTGANGAGKTTLLRAICRLVPLESGQIFWRGADQAADLEAFHAELSYLGHENALKGELTAAENLRFATRMRRDVEPGEIFAALERSAVAESADIITRRLSAGQRRRVALARLLLTRASLWVLDEPTSNLDQRGQALLSELLGAHLEQGGVAVVATHQSLNLPQSKICPLALQ